MNKPNVTMESLCGSHVLSGVDLGNSSLKQWDERFEDCCWIRFVLDGVIYQATEDPSDGYRSSMEDLAIVTDPVVNVFPPHMVTGTIRTTGEYGEVLSFTDERTGKVVLEVGTDTSDNYYPNFVAFFDPTAMAANHG